MILLDASERERLSKVLSERACPAMMAPAHLEKRSKEWNRLLTEHREILERLQPQHLKVLEGALRSCRQMELMIELLKIPHLENPLRKTLFDSFIEGVDESIFDLTQWLEALEIFDAWLKKNSRDSEVPKMLGYLECCAKSVEGKEYPLSLKDLCCEMLEAYGFLG